MKCHQIKCNSIATRRVFWPGSIPLFMCLEHAKKAVEIASAIGIYVQVEEFTDDTSGEGEDNSQDSEREVHKP